MLKLVLLFSLFSIPLFSFNQGKLTRDLFIFTNYRQRIISVSNKAISGIKIFSIGKTYSGKDIWCAEFQGMDRVRKKLMIIGGTHSLEWPAFEVPVRIIEDLAVDYAKGIKLKSDLIIVPILNPDGFDYMHYIPDFMGKTRANREYPPTEKNPRIYMQGVDLNRNFPVGWEFGPAFRLYYYRGPKPFSEPETLALRDFVERVHPDFAISFHSWGRLVEYPWSYKPDRIKDPIFISLCSNIASRIGFGFRPVQDYYDCQKTGTEIDWFYGSEKTKAVRIEIERHMDDLDIPEYTNILKTVKWMADSVLPGTN